MTTPLSFSNTSSSFTTKGITYTVDLDYQSANAVVANGSTVVVGGTNTLYYSLDSGVTWSGSAIYYPKQYPATITTVGAVNRLIWTGSQYVAVTASQYVLYSPDAKNWYIAGNAPSRFLFTSIAYGAGKYVGAMNYGLAYSTDLINWTPVYTFWSSSSATDLIWSGSYFAAANGNAIDYKILKSTDGVNWNIISDCYDRFAVVRQGGNLITFGTYGSGDVSTDGINWTFRTNTPVFVSASASTSIMAAVWNSSTSTFYGVTGGYSSTHIGSGVYLSTNGVYWSPLLLTGSLSGGTTATGMYTMATNGTSYVAGGYNAVLLYSSNGTNWTSTYSLPYSTRWQSVAYSSAAGLFFAIPVYNNIGGQAITNQAAASTDGINWTQRTMPIQAFWGAVTYGNGKFCAISGRQGQNTVVAVSTDTINWTFGSLPSSQYWSAVAYGGGFFVATAGYSYSTNAVASSTDGITWTTAALPSITYWGGITYGAGVFVTVAGTGGASTTTAATSTNGISWTLRTLPVSAFWYDVAYGSGVFVAVAGNSVQTAASSTDGITWTQRTLPVAGTWGSITHNGSIFCVVATGANSGTAAISTDGITWTARSMSAVATWGQVTSGSGKLVAVAYDSNIMAYSTDGNFWSSSWYTYPGNGTKQDIKSIIYANSTYSLATNGSGSGPSSWETSATGLFTGINVTQSLPVNGYWSAIEYSSTLGKYVAISGNPSTTSNSVAVSTNGIKWTLSTMPATTNWIAVAWGSGPGVFVALIYSSGSAASSTDGIIWTTRTMPTSATWKSVAYGNGVFAAIAGWGSLSLQAASSTDGITWTSRSLPGPTAYWAAVTFGAGVFVAVAGGYLQSLTRAAYSTDGVTWSSATLPVFAYWTDVTYGNGVFVAISGALNTSQNAATSTDGITWTQRTLATSSYWVAVSYSSGAGVFCAITGVVNNNTNTRFIAASSTDGITWTQRTLPVLSTWTDVVGTGSGFVAISGGGSSVSNSASSTDGINWTNVQSYPAIFAHIWDGSRYVVCGSQVVGTIDSTTGFYTVTNNTSFSGILFYGIAYNGSNLYMAGGSSNAIFTSTDVINWTQRTSPFIGGGTIIISRVYYDTNTSMFVLTTSGNGSTYIVNYPHLATTTDGITWSSVVGGGKVGSTIAYSNNTLVSAINNTQSVASANNGTTWTTTILTNNIPSSNLPGSLIVSDGKFRTMGSGTVPVSYYESTNGITWIPSSFNTYLPTNNGWRDMVYEPSLGIFCTVAPSGTAAATSTDGRLWTLRTLPTSTNWSGIAYGNGVFLSVAGFNFGNTNIAATSTDGITWTQRTLPTSANWKGVAFGLGVFAIIAYNTNVAAYSTDGITFTQITQASNSAWWLITFSSSLSLFVAIAGGPTSSSAASSSTNGINWTVRTMPSTTIWSAVTFGGGIFTAVAGYQSASQVAATSTDGITWTRRTIATTTAYWNGVAYGNGVYVAVAAGPSTVAAYSTDSITWTFSTLPINTYWGYIVYSSTLGYFVALGAGGGGNAGYYSAITTNGISWTYAPAAQVYAGATGNIFVGQYSSVYSSYALKKIGPAYPLKAITYG